VFFVTSGMAIDPAAVQPADHGPLRAADLAGPGGVPVLIATRLDRDPVTSAFVRPPGQSASRAVRLDRAANYRRGEGGEGVKAVKA
jgi:hypothetical protein